MIPLISQALYLTLILVGLVLGSTPERVAVLLVATVLLLRLSARVRPHSATSRASRRVIASNTSVCAGSSAHQNA